MQGVHLSNCSTKEAPSLIAERGRLADQHEGGTVKEPVRCERFQSLTDHFDKVIDTERDTWEYHFNKRVRATARREWEKALWFKSKNLSAHVDSCRVCEPPQEQPVRCDSYTQLCQQFERKIETATQEAWEAEARGHKAIAQIMRARARKGKERALFAHLVTCSTCE